MSTSAATHLLIHGRVQGVGYRAWLAGEAERRGLAGWVRNRREGSVEALILASANELSDFIAACRTGPPTARVTDITVSEQRSPEKVVGFEVRPTA